MLIPVLIGASAVGVVSFVAGCIIEVVEQKRKKESLPSSINREPNPYNESLYFTDIKRG